MTDYSIDWRSMDDPQPDSRRRGSTAAVLTVPMRGVPPPFFQVGWNEVMSYLMEETRGGLWESPLWTGSHIVVEGVEPGSEAALKAFLDEAVRQAIRHAERAASDARAEAETPSNPLGAAELAKMGDRFRR
jgi:hypothetical protein